MEEQVWLVYSAGGATEEVIWQIFFGRPFSCNLTWDLGTCAWSRQVTGASPTTAPLYTLLFQKIITFTLKKLELNWKGKIVDSNKNCGNWNCLLQRYIKHWFAVQAPTPAGTSSRSCLSAIGKKDVDVVHNGVHSCPASDQKHSPPSGWTYCDFYTTAVAGRPAQTPDNCCTLPRGLSEP